MPQLLDPNFRRAVVLLVHHDEDGTFGIVLNRSTEITAPSLCATLDIAWHGAQGRADRLGRAGAAADRLGALRRRLGSRLRRRRQVRRRPASSSPARSTCCDGSRVAPPERLRLLLGYAGWGPGQLEVGARRGRLAARAGLARGRLRRRRRADVGARAARHGDRARDPDRHARRPLTDRLVYTREELLESDACQAPLIAGGVRCHGGFDADGAYRSPRIRHRGAGDPRLAGAPRARGGGAARDSARADAAAVSRTWRRPSCCCARACAIRSCARSRSSRSSRASARSSATSRCPIWARWSASRSRAPRSPTCAGRSSRRMRATSPATATRAATSRCGRRRAISRSRSRASRATC